MIKPLDDRILFEPEPLQEKRGAIFVPESANQFQQYGHVRAKGDKCYDVEVDDRVVIRKHPVAVDITVDWKPHKILRMEDVLAKLI